MSRVKKIRLEVSKIRRTINVFVYDYDLANRTKDLLSWPNEDYNEPPVSIAVGEGEEAPYPSFCLEPEQAQELFEDLWKAGFRPGSHEPESYRNDHLEDLQELVHKILPSALRSPEED